MGLVVGLADGVADALGDAATGALDADDEAIEGVAGDDSIGLATTGAGPRLDASRSAPPPRTAINSTMAAHSNLGSERRRTDMPALSDRTLPHKTPRKYRVLTGSTAVSGRSRPDSYGQLSSGFQSTNIPAGLWLQTQKCWI